MEGFIEMLCIDWLILPFFNPKVNFYVCTCNYHSQTLLCIFKCVNKDIIINKIMTSQQIIAFNIICKRTGTYSKGFPQRRSDCLMSVNAQDHYHVVTRGHGKGLNKLEQFTQNVPQSPVPVVQLPDKLCQAGSNDDKEVRHSHMEYQSIHARFPSAVIPQPAEDQKGSYSSNDYLNI